MLEDLENDRIEALILSNPHFSKSRLNSLYGNFENLRHLNPEGFEANIEAWSSLLNNVIKSRILEGSKLSINTLHPNLSQILSIPIYGLPDCLGTIFNELVRRKVLVPYSSYRNATSSYKNIINDSAGISDYISPSSWVQWSMEKLGFSNTFSATNKKGELVSETYISWAVLCDVAQKHFRRIKGEIGLGQRSSLLFDKSLLYSFMKKLDPSLSQLDFEILLIYFSRDIGVCQIKYQDGLTYIKFKGQNEQDSHITEDDIGIIRLRATMLEIENRNTDLETKISNISDDMKRLLKSRNSSNQHGVNIRSRNLLSTRKVLIGSLEKSSSALIQLSTTVMKINDATSNKKIFDLLSQSSIVLKALNDSIDLDDIDNLQIELEENYDKTNMITDALTPETGHNDEELENELNELYQQESSNILADSSNKTTSKDNMDLIQKLEKMDINRAPLTEKERDLEEAIH